MKKNFIVFYDWDGTLIDSLPAHIKFLRDINKMFNFRLDLPNPKDIESSKKLVKSPMIEFLRNSGIPEEYINLANEIYSKEFSKNPRYNSNLFQGVIELIKNLEKKNISQGILTVNYQQNVNKTLRKYNLYNKFFLIKGKKELDRFYQGKKSEFLKDYKTKNNIPEEGMVYIGDSESDYDSAKKAEVPFIGVSYGWRFSREDKRDFPIANNTSELEQKILELV